MLWDRGAASWDAAGLCPGCCQGHLCGQSPPGHRAPVPCRNPLGAGCVSRPAPPAPERVLGAGGRRASLSNSSAAWFLCCWEGVNAHTGFLPACLLLSCSGLPKTPMSSRMRAEGCPARLWPQGSPVSRAVAWMVPEAARPRGPCLLKPRPHPVSSEPSLWICSRNPTDFLV